MKIHKKISILFSICALALSAGALAACAEPHEDKWSDWQVQAPTQTAAGSLTRTCSVEGCKENTQTIVLPVLNAENYTASVDTATCGAAGKIVYTLTVEGYGEYSTEVATPATGNHTLSPVGATAATCVAQGVQAHYKCSVCDGLFADEAGTTAKTADEVKTAIDASAHSLSSVAAKTATCAEDGYIAHYKCGDCSKLFADNQGATALTAQQIVSSKASVPHTLDKTAAKAVTCIEDGNQEYWQCSVCEDYFGDANGASKLTGKPVISKEDAAHQMQSVAGKTPTCKEDGVVAHYKCSLCNKLSLAQNGIMLIEEADTVISKESVAHSFSAWQITVPQGENEGSASHTCTVCDKPENLVLPKLSSPSYRVENTATCTEDGKKIYSVLPVGASEEVSFETSSSAYGHEWGAWVEWQKPSSGKYGYSVRRCAHDKTHAEQFYVPFLNAENYDITSTATCSQAGEKTYTLKDGVQISYKSYGATNGFAKVDASSIEGFTLPYTYSEPQAQQPHSGTWTITAPEAGQTGSAQLICTMCEQTTTSVVINENLSVTAMTSAGRGASSIEITCAVRDAHCDGQNIVKSDEIAIVDGKITGVGKDVMAALSSAFSKMNTQDRSVMTVFIGEDASEATVEEIASYIGKNFPNIEVCTVKTNQPVYPYIIAIE